MKKIFSLTMAFLFSASVCLFSSCAEKACEHSFGEWETVKEASCIAGQKQRVCATCNFTETEEIPALDDFFAHTFDENTLCTTCGHQEFIQSAEYMEPIKLSYYGSNGIDGILWWNKDKTYGLKILYFNARSHAIIKGFEGTPVHIQIPAYYDEIPITYINQPDEYSSLGTFQNCTTLKSIYIPDTVTRIEAYAFDGCTNLETVRFSQNLSWISEGAFRNCISLMHINLPNNLRSSINGFEGCSSLTEIYIPHNADGISGTAFNNCSSLKRIYIPKYFYDNYNHWIHKNAFVGCPSDLELIPYE